MTLGNDGFMYSGEMPSFTNALSRGVMPRERKSALKPSKLMMSVVGANSAVPLLTSDCTLKGVVVLADVVMLQATIASTANATAMSA